MASARGSRIATNLNLKFQLVNAHVRLLTPENFFHRLNLFNNEFSFLRTPLSPHPPLSVHYLRRDTLRV
jgi:hypothetical protein